MTSRRTAIATAATAIALGTLGLAGPATAATAATPAAASAASASAPVAPSATAAACDPTPWQAAVQGAPKGFGAGSRSGDYLWHDTTGFHLRVTHGRNHDQRVYSGEITSSAAMRIDRVKLEKGDTAKLSANHRTLLFVFADHGYIDGVNFHTDCASTLTVSRLHVGSSNLGRGSVYLGATRAHPGKVPFTVHRRPTTTT
jgi:hypothetical protein